MEDRMISAVLKDLRHHAGLTQAALSKELHISRQVYSCYETGRRLPDLDTAVKLCSYYHITLDELLHGCGDVIPDQYRQFIKSYDELNKNFSAKRDCLCGNPFFLFIPCIRLCLHRWYNALFPAESSL